MTQETQKQYVCIEFIQTQHSLLHCNRWQILDAEPDLPFTKEEADQITIAVCIILVTVWGFRRAIKLIEDLKK